jgi:hypothetical protein
MILCPLLGSIFKNFVTSIQEFCNFNDLGLVAASLATYLAMLPSHGDFNDANSWRMKREGKFLLWGSDESGVVPSSPPIKGLLEGLLLVHTFLL